MWSPKKSIRLSLVVTYIFIGLLVVGTVLLPGIVTWYVEVRGREPSLPATIMLTCYPCVPFATYALWALQKLLRNVLAGKVLVNENRLLLHRVSWCCFAGMVIMLIAGRRYLPFYVCAICTAFMGLILRVVKNFLFAALPPEEKAKAEGTASEKAAGKAI